MADGRKNNGGHSTKGKAGRPKKIDEEKLFSMMDAIMKPAEVWEKLADKVKDGDTNAQKLWLSYRVGNPTSKVEVTGKDGDSLFMPTPPQVIKPK